MLTQAQVRSILAYRKERTPQELATMFGVHSDSIKSILKRRTWKRVMP